MGKGVAPLVSYYIALIHKEPDGGYGVSFPDVPGVTTAADSIDEAMQQAAGVLAFAAVDWGSLKQEDFPSPRTIDELRDDPEFAADAMDAIVAAVPMKSLAHAAWPQRPRSVSS
jgi:predicted RNase H-like HicB family nuclease